MSYIVEQKVNGKIYLYKVDAYWDKDKKQSRQKRSYIGPKDSSKKDKIKAVDAQLITKKYGNILLFEKRWIPLKVKSLKNNLKSSNLLI